MRFAIITHAVHKLQNQKVYAYEPYVREINLWLQHVSETKIVAPISNETITNIEIPHNKSKIEVVKIPAFNLLTVKNKITSILKIPFIFFKIIKACYWADHIHLRCPGNIGLLGCFVQILFPFKKKTVKYAGNWDPNSKQPFSYRLQKWIVSNTFLTRNCKVLVYGEWENQSKNIIPFFTASYKKTEIIDLPQKSIKGTIKFIYVGAFTKSKQPMLSVEVVDLLINLGYKVELNMFGNGAEFDSVANFIKKNNLTNSIFLHGNQSKDEVKKAFQTAHFLIFVSKSEGWPKVVAEAMFWSCLPISSKVSCVPFMLDFGKRGSIVSSNKEEIVSTIKNYIFNSADYYQKVQKAKSWSQSFTLDKFSKEITKLV
jgi:glycosyltransferase involved in cell wall biosynthesis